MGSNEQQKDSLEIRKTTFIKDLEIKNSRAEKKRSNKRNLRMEKNNPSTTPDHLLKMKV